MSQSPVEEMTRSVLIVDDEGNMRESLAAILLDEGYEVATASTGEEAVRLCDQREFDVVLMDVRMPGMDGMEVFRHIRRHRRGVRVILMSAYSVEGLKEAALAEGAIAFLSKPLDVEKLLRLIGEAKHTAVLVVEPDQETAGLLTVELKKEGYRVTATHSPYDALALVEQIRFDLIFLNMRLNAMNGYELYMAIKAINPWSVTILMAEGGNQLEELAHEAVRRSAYAVVYKPLDMPRVLRMVEWIAGRRASADDSKPPREL
ncbi:MAG TPA: response regulator [Planctomycetaceae bacterium]|nr:response regulator [Planctomycetaceae bacterium]HIQ21640.1 response regulator [Planctomycetota bacterium]